MRVFAILIFSCLVSFGTSTRAQEEVQAKMDSIILPSVEFASTPLADALAFVHQKSVALDPDKQGVNVVILEPDLRDNPVTLKLANASLGDVLRYTTMVAGATINTTKFAVTITKPPETPEEPEKFDTGKMDEKLKSIVIPDLEFNDTPLVDALSFLVLKSSELDPAKKGGINVVYLGKRDDDGMASINLRLSNIPLSEVLKYTVQIAGHSFRIEPNAVVVTQ
jgi:hypothetical protein